MEEFKHATKPEHWDGLSASKKRKLMRVTDLREIDVKPVDLIGILLELEPKQAIFLQDKQIMPFLEGKTKNYHNFKKEYRSILVTEVRPTRERALSERYNPNVMIRTTLQNNKEVGFGYSWRSFRPGPEQFVSLDGVLEGAELFAYEYSDINAKAYSRSLSSKVPSRHTKNKVWGNSFDHLPFSRYNDTNSKWLELIGETQAPRRKWYSHMTHRRLGPKVYAPEEHTPDMIAAYHKAMEQFDNTNDEIEFNPFILPKEIAVILQDNMRNRVIVEYSNQHDVLSERCVNRTEREFLQWHLMFTKGFDTTWSTVDSIDTLRAAYQITPYFSLAKA